MLVGCRRQVHNLPRRVRRVASRDSGESGGQSGESGGQSGESGGLVSHPLRELWLPPESCGCHLVGRISINGDPEVGAQKTPRTSRNGKTNFFIAKSPACARRRPRSSDAAPPTPASCRGVERSVNVARSMKVVLRRIDAFAGGWRRLPRRP